MKMASGDFEDEAEGTVTINEYIESLDAEELVNDSLSLSDPF